MKNIISRYFNLGLFEESAVAEPNLGPKHRKEDRKIREHRKIIWTLLLYLGVLLGVVGQQFLSNIVSFNRVTLISSAIVGTVVFPQIYKQARLNARNPNIMQLFIAFQNGFFWQNLLTILTKLLGGNP